MEPKKRVVQVFYIDDLGIKRIVDRVITDKPVMEVLKIRNHRVYDFERHCFVITPGYEVEELPLPEEVR